MLVLDFILRPHRFLCGLWCWYIVPFLDLTDFVGLASQFFCGLLNHGGFGVCPGVVGIVSLRTRWRAVFLCFCYSSVFATRS